ncbi:MAG: hypothetical protein KGQ59_12300, partial [Bdellovibrionales bacterium]|nr:hypothetical protein [Bdellovibrionales bacterium]
AGALMIVPILAVAYYLKKESTAPLRFSLVSRTFSNSSTDSETVLMSGIEPKTDKDGKVAEPLVVFARKLGTSELSIVLNK